MNNNDNTNNNNNNNTNNNNNNTNTSTDERFIAARYLQKLLSSRRDQHLSAIGRTPYTDIPLCSCVPSLPPPGKGRLAGDLPFPSLVLAMDPQEVARQLTLGDHEVYRALLPAELLSRDWNSTDPLLKANCPGLLAIIDRFNRVTGAIVHLILAERALARRRKTILRLIEVMQHLFELNNCFGVIAFSSCFSSGPVKRLKHTFASLGIEPLSRLDLFHKFSSPEHQYSEYRAHLRRISPPAVPYLGSFLQEIVYVNERKPTYLHGLLNFDKLRAFSSIIQNVTVFQKRSFPFASLYQFQSGLNTYPLLGEDALYDLSLAIEPRNASKKDVK